MKHNPTHIGQVESVSGNSVIIKMASSYPSNMPIIDGTVYRIGQIGSFLKIPLGYANLYGLVTQAGVIAMPDALLMAYKENPLMASSKSPTRGHPKFPQAARSDYDGSALIAIRAAASLSL